MTCLQPPVSPCGARWKPATWALQVLGRLGQSFGAGVDGDDLVLPAGEAEIRLRPVATPDGVVAEWRWVARPGSAITVPDAETSSLEIHVVPHPDGGAAELAHVLTLGVIASAAYAFLVWRAWRMVQEGRGLANFRTAWLVEDNAIGFLVFSTVLGVALVVAVGLRWHQHRRARREWKELERPAEG